MAECDGEGGTGGEGGVRGGVERIKRELQRRRRLFKDGKDTADKRERRAQQGAVWLHQNRPEISQHNNGLAASCGPTFRPVKDVLVSPAASSQRRLAAAVRKLTVA